MKPTSKCPYFAEEFDDCPACHNYREDFEAIDKCVVGYCEIDAADKNNIIDGEEYKYDKEH